MRTVQKGDFVKVHYTGRLDNGEIFDSSEGRSPFEFQVGSGQVIPGFENSILGMKLNEKKTFTIEPEDAYGDRDERLVQTFQRAELPMDFQPSVGEI
ncbi:MAG: FKBP-type peptidyl-prolyl cis-trans isomerase, partial [Thermodesulforhabdaceae bacterium]